VVPEFIAKEYSEGVIIHDTGMLSTSPDAAEILEHLTTEDLMEELYYKRGLDSDNEEDNNRRFSSEPEFAKPVVIADQAHRQAQLAYGL
jgi:hypothetical protein